MPSVKELINNNKHKKYIPHSTDSLNNLTQAEKESCFSIGILSYPVIRLNTSDTTKYIFKHSDTRFETHPDFDMHIQQKRRLLSFNEEFHIRCKSIKYIENTYYLETEWSDYSQFLGTNAMMKSNEVLREKVQHHYLISPLLSNELAAIGTFIINDNQEKYIMLTKRGSTVSTYADCMSSSVSGAMGGGEKWMDFNEVFQPDPLLTIVRETKEELGLDIEMKNLTLDGLCIQAIDKQPIFLVSDELSISREEIFHKTQTAQDKDEIDDEGIIFVPFQLDQLLPYLIYLDYSPISAVGIWTLIEKHFSKNEIEAAFLKIWEG